MYLAPPVGLADVRYKAVVLLLLIRCFAAPVVCGCSVFGTCFVMQYIVSFLCFQSS